MGWLCEQDGSPALVIYAGARGLPAHYYEDCPHFGRLFDRNNGSFRYYQLAENALVGTLIRCHWCRAKWREEQLRVPVLRGGPQ